MRTFIVLVALCVAATQAEDVSRSECVIDQMKAGQQAVITYIKDKSKQYPPEAKAAVEAIEGAAKIFTDEVKKMAEELRESPTLANYFNALKVVSGAIITAGRSMTSAVYKNAEAISQTVRDHLLEDCQQISVIIAQAGKDAVRCIFPNK